MKNLLVFISLSLLTATALSQNFSGVMNSALLGQQVLNVKLNTAFNAKAQAIAEVSREHDSWQIFCNSSLQLSRLGLIEFSMGSFNNSEVLSVAVASKSEVIENESDCTTQIYTNVDVKNNHWFYSGSNSSLILSVKKSGLNTITQRLTLQFAMPMFILDGDLVRQHETDTYYLQNLSLKLKETTYITYQIVEETRGEYTSVSTLEQGRIFLK